MYSRSWRSGGGISRVDVSKLILSSIPVNAEAIDKSADGKVVSVSGELKAEKEIGDPGYLNFGPYILLNRRVEMFAWVQQQTTEIRETYSGREIEEPKLSYSEEWLADPPDSDLFLEPEGHRNPPLSITDRTFKVQTALVGAYRIPAARLQLPEPSRVAITKKVFVPSLNRLVKDDYIYMRRGGAQSPQIGDIRIYYTAVPVSAQVTVFGKLNGDSIEPCVLKEGQTFLRAVAGSRGNAIAALTPTRSSMMGLIRWAGFFMMWVGLWLLFAPINAVLGIVSVKGNARHVVIAGAMLAIAVCLSLLTLLVSAVAHNAVVLVLVLVAVAASSGYAGRKWVPAMAGAASVGRPDTLSLSNHGFEQQETAVTGNSGAASEQIQFECENCGKHYVVPASYGGKKARCKDCNHKFLVPMKSPSKM